MSRIQSTKCFLGCPRARYWLRQEGTRTRSRPWLVLEKHTQQGEGKAGLITRKNLVRALGGTRRQRPEPGRGGSQQGIEGHRASRKRSRLSRTANRVPGVWWGAETGTQSGQTAVGTGVCCKMGSLWEPCPRRPGQKRDPVSQDHGLLRAEPKVHTKSTGERFGRVCRWGVQRVPAAQGALPILPGTHS